MPQHPPIQLTTPYFPIELGYDLTDDLIALGFITQGFAYFGGGDLSVESFRYRHELWKYTRIAGSTLRRVPFWKGVPCDSKVTGEVIDPVYGGAEVFASLYPGSPATDDFMLVYFPRTGVAQGAQLCSVDLSHAPSGGSYTGAFFNPESGAFLSMFLTNPNPGSAFAVTSPVGPDSDLLLIFVRQ